MKSGGIWRAGDHGENGVAVAMRVLVSHSPLLFVETVSLHFVFFESKIEPNGIKMNAAKIFLSR